MTGNGDVAMMLFPVSHSTPEYFPGLRLSQVSDIPA